MAVGAGRVVIPGVIPGRVPGGKRAVARPSRPMARRLAQNFIVDGDGNGSKISEEVGS